jgi:broad specificity phosphatase PhoE
MSRLLLVRHGITKYNNDRRFMGHSDIEMSDIGQRQIERLGNYLKDEKIDAVYASDLKRTMMSAKTIIGGRDLDVVPCHELREMNYGVCEGLTFGEIGLSYPDVAEKCAHFTLELEFPEGEKFQEFIDRSSAFLEKLKKHKPKETILVVSHNGPLKVLICRLLEISMEHWWQIGVDVASLSIMETGSRGAILTRLNDTSFLKGN